MSEARPTITVWFSCGAASAVAAKKTIELYGDTHAVTVVNTPVAEEDIDNRRFLKDVEMWIGQQIHIATNPRWPDNSAVIVWQKRRFMSGRYGAPCTLELKKEARYAFERANPSDFIVLGFTVDEKERHDRFVLTERSNVIPVLIDAGINKYECFRILEHAKIKLPRVYQMGYPNANCIGCVKATSATYWNLVRAQHPDVFAERAKQSRELGVRLARSQVNGKLERVYLDELAENAKGQALSAMSFECGLFCEEKTR
jgi:hypothetical protein